MPFTISRPTLRAMPEPGRPPRRDDETLAEQVGEVLDSGIARSVGREIVKGIFGMLKRSR